MSGETIWKVVHRTWDGKLVSACVGLDFQLEYGSDWVEGRCGPIFAYKTLEGALRLARPCISCEVWEAEAVNVREIVYAVKVGALSEYGPEEVHKWWKGREWMPVACVPEGTVVCDKIRLVKRVHV